MFSGRIPLLVLLLLLIWLTAACANQANEYPVTLTPDGETTILPTGTSDPGAAVIEPTATIPAVTTEPTENRSQPPASKPAPETEERTTRYELIAVLDYWSHHLGVDEKISFTNRSSDTLTELLLIVEPTRYPSVFRLTGMTWEDGEEVTNYAFDLGQITIPLPEPLPPGEQINLSLSYELNIPSPDSSYYGRPVPFGYTDRQTNMVDWYPFIPPYIPGEGWLVNQAGAFGEHLVYEIADFEVDIQLVGNTKDLVIAASAAEEINGEWHRYQHKAARNFAWSVSHMYEVTSKTLDEVTVLNYAFPMHAAAGERTLQVTAEALALYNQIYSPYPRDTLSVVEADFLDGMEFDGLYFLSNGFYNLYSGKPDDYLTAIAAHETAHQWWYAQVGNDQAHEPWLDEALCTYSERLYFENLYPEALDWWWTYRVFYYEPRGWVDGSIYNPEGYRAYRDAVYLNGAVFLEELRETIGEQAFFAFLTDFALKNTGRIATADDFFAILEEHTQTDISTLMVKYFFYR
jgi:hypothetical protein